MAACIVGGLIIKVCDVAGVEVLRKDSKMEKFVRLIASLLEEKVREMIVRLLQFVRQEC